MPKEFGKKDAKAWARENFKGLEAPVFPSFTPDLAELDEDGIRYDVNHIIANGMKSILIAPEGTGMTMEEIKRFTKIVNEEVNGRVHTSISAVLNTVEDNIASMQYHEECGGTMAMLGHPLMYDPLDQDELVRMYKYMADSVNLGLVFYAGRLKLKRWDPKTGWPMDTLPKIADIDNVVAQKIQGGNTLEYTIECFERVGDKILVADPMTPAWWTTIPKYGQQWAGAGPFYSSQTPENPRHVKLFNALVEGRIEDAKAIQAEFMGKPRKEGEYVYSAFNNVNYPETGILCAFADKYSHWLCGGNGGILRQPSGRLYDYQKKSLREQVERIGIQARENEEEFFLGRMNYAKGYRLKRY